MASTKIVLNRQSDLILNNASIVAPVGIVIADIAGLVSTVASIDSKGTGDMSAEASLRIAGDVSVTAAMSAEISTRVVAETSLQNNIDAEASLRTADVDAEESRAIAAEGSLAANLSTEVSRAIIAEASLNTKVEFVISNVDGQAIDSLTEIVTAFQNADGDINGAITLLSGSASAANSAEASIRLAADESIAANLSTELVDRAAAVSTEVVARISGDTSIALDLSAEVAARISDVDAEQVRAESAETVLTANLSSELVARAAAVSTEESSRVAGDISIAANLSSELVARASADASIATGLSSELVARAAAVSTEASLRVVADASIAANLSTELIARVSGDASVMLALSATFSSLPMTDGSTIILDAATNTVQLKEAVAAPASGTRTFSGLINVAAQPATLAGFGDLSLVTKAYASAAVSTEASLRIVADASIATGLSSELVARAAAVSGEASLRTVADASIATNLSTEKARIDAILLASAADKDSFAEIVTLINSVDTTNDEAFAGYVLANNAALSTEVSNRTEDVNAEESRATSAELSLDTDLGLHNMGGNSQYSDYLSALDNGYEFPDGATFTSADCQSAFGPANLANYTMFVDLWNYRGLLQNTQNVSIGIREELSTEVSRAEFAEGSLATQISTELSTANASVEGALSSEISRATEAEGSIAIQLSSEVSYIIANTDLTSIDSFAEVVADMSSEVSTRESIDDAIKAGVNTALLAIKHHILNTARLSRVRLQLEAIGDNIETVFVCNHYHASLGDGVVYLNGLLQEEGDDYTHTSDVNGKGQHVNTYTFLTAPDAGSKIKIYGMDSQSDIDFSPFTPLV